MWNLLRSSEGRAPAIKTVEAQREPEFNGLSCLRNPFGKAHITDISLHWCILPMTERIWIYGDVKFKNGDTKGEQRFEAETFDQLIMKVKTFLDGFK